MSAANVDNKHEREYALVPVDPIDALILDVGSMSLKVDTGCATPFLGNPAQLKTFRSSCFNNGDPLIESNDVFNHLWTSITSLLPEDAALEVVGHAFEKATFACINVLTYDAPAKVLEGVEKNKTLAGMNSTKPETVKAAFAKHVLRRADTPDAQKLVTRTIRLYAPEVDGETTSRGSMVVADLADVAVMVRRTESDLKSMMLDRLDYMTVNARTESGTKQITVVDIFAIANIVALWNYPLENGHCHTIGADADIIPPHKSMLHCLTSCFRQHAFDLLHQTALNSFPPENAKSENQYKAEIASLKQHVAEVDAAHKIALDTIKNTTATAQGLARQVRQLKQQVDELNARRGGAAPAAGAAAEAAGAAPVVPAAHSADSLAAEVEWPHYKLLMEFFIRLKDSKRMPEAVKWTNCVKELIPLMGKSKYYPTAVARAAAYLKLEAKAAGGSVAASAAASAAGSASSAPSKTADLIAARRAGAAAGAGKDHKSDLPPSYAASAEATAASPYPANGIAFTAMATPMGDGDENADVRAPAAKRPHPSSADADAAAARAAAIFAGSGVAPNPATTRR